MALRSHLSLWAYTSPTTSAYPLLVQEYGEALEALEFSTVAPGGFGDLACVIKLADGRLPRPELGLFSRVALTDGPFCCFSGEWSDPALVLDGSEGDHLLASALGGGLALRDDPDDSSYTNQTAQQIIAAEFNKRSAYLAVDSDTSLIFPTNPATQFSPIYDGYNVEEILHDLCFALGDDVWAVWDHPTHKDNAGFPTWQVAAHSRDVTTTGYIALDEDIVSWRVTPSEQRAYNVVQLAYVDVTGGPGVVTVSDTRLAGNGAQGNAPFRRRKLRRKLTGTPLTSAQATTIAQAWLAQYQNITNKVEVELRSVRDANGMPLPLHQVRSDKNLFVPQLAVRGQTLSSGPVAGVNQFYLVETVYRETAAGDARLVCYLDNYADQMGKTVAKLHIASQAASRARGAYRPAVASPGASEVGWLSLGLGNQVAGQNPALGVNFKSVLQAAPTSITLTVTASNNVGSTSVSNLSVYGFNFNWTVPANGSTVWLGTYKTNGN